MKTVNRIAELYGRLLMLRMENIVETKRRWPDQSVEDQIDMLTYQPQLIIDIMLNIDWMVALEGLSLSWDQKKAALGNFHRRDVQRMERVHRADLKTIDIQATLSESVPDPAWMKASVDALVNQYIATLLSQRF
jgi:hypothetical protein